MKLFVDHLTVIDCSYLHAQHGIEGESWIVDIALEGDLDDQSMIMDFGHVKKRLKAAIDREVDHKLLVPMQSEHLSALEQGGAEQTTLHWRDAQGRSWEHRSPEEALCRLDTDVVSQEAVCEFLRGCLMPEMPETVQALHMTLHHERIDDGLYYHYSHGLKKHDGNCQRIAHGHRSRIEIWRDGALDEQAMREWCKGWAHIYLVSEGDIIEQTDEHIISEYSAPQGEFWLSAPRSACDVLPEDSTVERIAQHIAQQLKNNAPEAVWSVKAFEGVRKGAIITL